MGLLELKYYGSDLRAWAIAAAAAVATATALFLLRGLAGRVLSGRAERTGSEAARLFADAAMRLRFYFILAVAAYAGSQALTLQKTPSRVLGAAVAIAVLIQIGVWGNGLIAFLIAAYVSRTVEQDPAAATTMSAFGFVGRLVLWTIVVLVGLASLGVNVTALIAGLGVGGIAVALALQNVLGDLFASFSIVIDKPFVIGDFIVVGEFAGTVEHIGLKTTRLRSLSGEQLVFSNGDLLGSRVRNYKRMTERRALFGFGVTYDTPLDNLSAIPGIVREIVESREMVRFDRAHFKAYGDYALLFEVVYYVTDPSYNVYMDTQQAINLELLSRFSEHGIRFAYPTRTLYVERGDAPASP